MIQALIGFLDALQEKSGMFIPVAAFLVIALVVILAVYYFFCFLASLGYRAKEARLRAHEKRQQELSLRRKKREAVLSGQLQIETMAKEFDSLKAAQAAKDKESKQESARMARQLEQQGQALKEQEERLRQAEAERKRLSEELRTARTSGPELQERHDVLVKEMSKLQEKLGKAAADNESMKTQAKAAEARVRELESALREARRGEGNAGELEIKKENERLRQNSEALEGRLSTLQKEAGNLKESAEQQAKDLKALNKAKEKLENLNAAASAEEALLKDELEKTADQLSSLEQKYEERQRDVRKSEQKAKEAQEASVKLQQEIIQLKLALEREKAKVGERQQAASPGTSKPEITEPRHVQAAASQNETLAIWLQRFNINPSGGRIWITREELERIKEDLRGKTK